MKIITEKWSWAEPVKSKGVYRDEEFVVTDTQEEALKAIDFLLKQPKGLTYTITVFRDGKYFTYFRHSMPCYGGLVKYLDSHGERYFMNPYFPRDIYVAFPEGQIVFIGCTRQKTPKNEYQDFILSEESPWVSCFGSRDTIIFKDTYFILTNMNTDPTVFYSLLRLSGFMGGVYGAGVNNANIKHPKAQILFGKSSLADPRRLAGQKPFRISGGTWAEGFGYTRPYNESIFKTKLPHKLKDFRGVGSYPQAPHDNKYFVETMQKVFKVDINKPDAKTNDALVEAWEYFKEEAKKLDE